MATGNDLLVGSTGFVGGNLSRQHVFGKVVHSSDVEGAYGLRPSLCVYAGVPSAMFLANRDPEADLAIMRIARENMRRIAPEKIVLVSTIAVYADSKGKDETSPMTEGGLSPYGANRLQLEKWVREDFDNALIVRLPALYGAGLKKNFIKDLVCVAPPLLADAKYIELASRSALVARSYDARGDGFHALRPDSDLTALRSWFAGNDFNALSFTDSRSRFQFYGLDRLWADVLAGIDGGWGEFNLATPPVSAAEVYRHVRGGEWVNELDREPFDYDMRTVHVEGGYLCSRAEELDALKTFVEAQA